MSANILVVASVLAILQAAVSAKIHRVLASPDIPVTSFSCQGRPIGYYADVETNCQVYHMCGEGGRQYSYSCPNTTLFHQRMLICAHWYQVNCNSSMAHYSANLLIGQRDKPFVDDFISSDLGEEIHDIGTYKNPHNTKVSKYVTKSLNQVNKHNKQQILNNNRRAVSSSITTLENNSDLQRSQSGSIASRQSSSFSSPNRFFTNQLNNNRDYNKGGGPATGVAVKPTSVTEPTGAVPFRPTNVSFRSTIETPNSEPLLARTAPMTSSQPSHRTESAFKHSETITPSNNIDEEGQQLLIGDTGEPSRELLPPLLPELLEQTNTIELRLDDPRRALYIPRTKNHPSDVKEKPIVVTINLRGQTGFRSSTFVNREKLTQCNRCHPAFVIDKKNCTPCLLIS